MSNEQKQPLPLLPHLCSPSAILGLVLIGELLSLVIMLADYSSGFSWVSLGIISMLVQWIILSCALILCQLRPLLNRLSMAWSGCLAFSLCIVISSIILWLAPLIMAMPSNSEQWARSTSIAAIFAGILLRYLYLQQQLSNQQQAELEARIQSLQSRIKPHFLFNSMNTIASLISFDAKAAEKTIEDLSELFRSSLQNPSLVNLADEIGLCRRYIDIEKIRLGERLTMSWDIEAPTPQALVPSLFIQPLLENAIGHGIQQLIEGGTVILSVSQTNNTLHIAVTNPVPEVIKQDRTNGNKIALSNIKNRLHLHYGDKAQLKTESNNKNNQFIVRITLPIIKSKSLTER